MAFFVAPCCFPVVYARVRVREEYLRRLCCGIFCILHPNPAPEILLGGAGGADFSVMMGKNKFFYRISGVVWGRVVKWCKTVV